MVFRGRVWLHTYCGAKKGISSSCIRPALLSAMVWDNCNTYIDSFFDSFWLTYLHPGNKLFSPNSEGSHGINNKRLLSVVFRGAEVFEQGSLFEPHPSHFCIFQNIDLLLIPAATHTFKTSRRKSIYMDDQLHKFFQRCWSLLFKLKFAASSAFSVQGSDVDVEQKARIICRIQHRYVSQVTSVGCA